MNHYHRCAAGIAAATFAVAVLQQSAAAAPGAPPDPLARAIFRELIEINTTASAGDTTVAARAMASRLLAGGFAADDVQVLVGPNPRRGNLVARLRGNGAHRPVLIIGHLDVVEARREDWSTDPFVFTEKDGYFYGRGTQDMKDADAIAVACLVRLRQEGFVPDRDIILALTADEEGGPDNGVNWLLKTHRDLIDAEFVMNPDAGGVDSDGGVALTFNLEATEKLYADFQLLATDPGGHSSQPRPGNPIYQIADALGRLERSPFPFELNAVTRAWLGFMAGVESGPRGADIQAVLRTPPDPEAIARLSQDARYNATQRTTCVATRLAAGHANNALPQRASAVVNCRILPGHSAEEVRQDLLRTIADPRITLSWMDPATGEARGTAPDTRAMTPPAPRADLMQALRRTAATLWPGVPIVPEMETGASDSIYTMFAGIPSYGFFGTAIDRDDMRAHGKDERLGVRSFDDGMAFYYRFLKALTGTQP
jgi:acetylornithine deacetylase/succinyl-diaminopimelate desuccinylase-like protein